jgi:small subunit ribosomal protein S20
MANIKSNIKSIRKTERRTKANKSVISSLKTQIKKTRNSATPDNLSISFRKLDSAAAKGKIAKNKANRTKSRLAKSINKKNSVSAPVSPVAAE